jgi:predicted hydrocarbon binding protein
LTKLYIITYIKKEKKKTILTTHYEKMKNQIKNRIEVVKDNHSKNLKENQETLCHFNTIMQTFESSITSKEEGF